MRKMFCSPRLGSEPLLELAASRTVFEPHRTAAGARGQSRWPVDAFPDQPSTLADSAHDPSTICRVETLAAFAELWRKHRGTPAPGGVVASALLHCCGVNVIYRAFVGCTAALRCKWITPCNRVHGSLMTFDDVPSEPCFYIFPLDSCRACGLGAGWFDGLGMDPAGQTNLVAAQRVGDISTAGFQRGRAPPVPAAAGRISAIHRAAQVAARAVLPAR